MILLYEPVRVGRIVDRGEQSRGVPRTITREARVASPPRSGRMGNRSFNALKVSARAQTREREREREDNSQDCRRS